MALTVSRPPPTVSVRPSSAKASSFAAPPAGSVASPVVNVSFVALPERTPATSIPTSLATASRMKPVKSKASLSAVAPSTSADVAQSIAVPSLAFAL